MRIAYVCADQGVPVFGRKGCSVHVQEVVRAFARQGGRVELLTPRPEGEQPPGLETVPVHALPRAEGAAADRERAALAGNDALGAALERTGPFDLLYERYSLWSFPGMEHARAAGARLTGAVPRDEVPRLLAGMDAAVAPYCGRCPFYFSPLKVYQYMAAGLPVVASRLGQLGGLIRHGVNGLLCPPGDAPVLADALAQLRAAPGLRRRLGEAARATVLGQHAWAAVADCILRLAEAAAAPGLVARGREVP